ncbi:unnamed protein product, partial [Owenia fusiformis]
KKYKRRVRRKLSVPNGPPTCPGESIETGYINCDQPPCYVCPPPPHWRYTSSPPWCCLEENNNPVWHQPLQNNEYKCLMNIAFGDKNSGVEIKIKSCPDGFKFIINAWNSCFCVNCTW